MKSEWNMEQDLQTPSIWRLYHYGCQPESRRSIVVFLTTELRRPERARCLHCKKVPPMEYMVAWKLMRMT
jgi:hypothetical protein